MSEAASSGFRLFEAPPSFRRGATIGAAIGLVVAIALLAMAVFGGGESGEGAALLAYVLAMPAALVFEQLDWGSYASQWNAFIAISLPLNGLLLGCVIGAIAQSRSWTWRRWSGLFAATWIAVVICTWFWSARH